MNSQFNDSNYAGDRQNKYKLHKQQNMQELLFERRSYQAQINDMPLSASNPALVHANTEEERPYIASSSAQMLLFSTEDLTAALTSSLWQQRLDAIRIVTTLGKQVPPRILPRLEEALFDVSSFVRAAAAQAIGEVGEKAQMKVLLRKVNDPEPHVRASVIQALGSFGKFAPLDLLEEALEDPDEIVREAAIWAIAGLEDHTLSLRLIALLKDESEIIRAAVAEALGTIKQQLPQEPLIQILTAASKDEDGLVRATALQALGQFGNDIPITFFLQAFQDEDGPVRATVVRILGEREELICIETLILALQDDDEIVRQEISIALGKLSLQSYRQLSSTFLLATLLHQHEQVRCMGAWILGECKEAAALPALMHLVIRDPNQEVRIVTTCALGKYHEQAARETLAQVALYDSSPQVRSAAVSSLEEHVLLSTVMHLIAHESSQDVQITAINALKKYHKRVAPKTLTQIALHGLDPQVRSAAILALGEVREPEEPDPLETLVHLTEDENRQVQQAAQQMLAQRIQCDDTVCYQQRQPQPLEEAYATVLQPITATNQGTLAKMLLTSLLNFIERKKGFINANTYNEQTLVLNFGYQHDDEHKLRDALLTSLAPRIYVDNIDSALSDQNAEIRLIASRVYELLQERPWTEMLILSCDFSREEQELHGKKIPTRMVVCLVGYSQVREDDVSISQSLADYLHPNRRHPFYRKVRDWTDIAFFRAQHCSEVKIWYSTPLPAVQTPMKTTPAMPFNRLRLERNVAPPYQQRVQKKYRLMPLSSEAHTHAEREPS